LEENHGGRCGRHRRTSRRLRHAMTPCEWTCVAVIGVASACVLQPPATPGDPSIDESRDPGLFCLVTESDDNKIMQARNHDLIEAVSRRLGRRSPHLSSSVCFGNGLNLTMPPLQVSHFRRNGFVAPPIKGAVVII